MQSISIHYVWSSHALLFGDEKSSFQYDHRNSEATQLHKVIDLAQEGGPHITGALIDAGNAATRGCRNANYGSHMNLIDKQNFSLPVRNYKALRVNLIRG